MTTSRSNTKLPEGKSGQQGGSFSRDIEAVVNYLNDQTGSSFRTDTKATVSLLDALFHKGYTLHNIQRVIDYKISKWNNPRMKKYLRPKTLFDRYQFKWYLHELEVVDLLTRKQDKHD